MYDILNILWKKDEPHSLSISKIIDSETRGYLIFEKVLY